MPNPRWMPLPELFYAHVVKSYRRRRLVGVTHRVVFGTGLAIEQVLARCGWTIKPAFVERLNLDIRQRVAAIGRRVNTLCQGAEGLRDQLVLFQTYHNFVLPHASLRQPFAHPLPTNGDGSAKLWQPYKQNLENLRRNHYASIRRGLSCVTYEINVMRPQGAKRCAPSKATFPIMRSRP